MYFPQLLLPFSSLPTPFTAYISVQPAPISSTQLEVRLSHLLKTCSESSFSLISSSIDKLTIDDKSRLIPAPSLVNALCVDTLISSR